MVALEQANKILILGGTGDRNVEIHDCCMLDTNSKQVTQMELPVQDKKARPIKGFQFFPLQ